MALTEDIELDRALIKRGVVGLVVILLVAGLCGLLFRQPITLGADWFHARFGLAGIFAGVMFTDSSPIPLTHEPFLFLGIGAGVDPWVLFGVAATASVLAGPVGYTGGWLLRRNARFRGWLTGRYPTFNAFMRRYGARGVAIAAFLPIPFALSTWSAGMTGVSFPHVLLASLVRIPKTGFYLSLIAMGWAAGA